MRIKIGSSIDIHQLCDNRQLYLGGVNIEHSKGLKGHSDADVLIHAVCESIIGALGLGDIGKHFSDKDPRFKNIRSTILLEEVYKMMAVRNYEIGNIDCTILAERPILRPFIPEMVDTIAKILHTDKENVNVKATRGEKLGFIGREEGIVAFATVLIINN